VSAKTLDQCGYDGHEMIRYAEKRGARIRRGKGDHVIVETPRGQETVPDRDLGHGLGSKIKKSLAFLLAAGVIFICFWLQYLSDKVR